MKNFLLLLLLLGNLFAIDATIQIVKHLENAPGIALKNNSIGNEGLNEKFHKMLIGDLKVSSNFKIDKNTQQQINNIHSSTSALDYILEYSIKLDDANALQASINLLNAKSGDTYFNKSYRISHFDKYPFLAHKIVMDINEKLKLPTIKWMDRLVVFARYVGAKQSQILISDYTLTYKKVIIQGGLNLFPKWANKDQNAFYYTAYDNGLPTLYKYDLYSASKTKLTSSPGMLVCSDVSSDGLKLLLTMTTNDQPDIYLYDVVSGQKRRVTSFKGIEVNGSFVDNEQKVVFVSDALGYPNIFAVNIDGSGFEQMVFHGKNNNTCSTSGKYIVYSSREGSSEFGRNVFNLYLMSTTSDYVRKLTATGKNLYPRFANDGETVMFIKEFQRQSALGVIRLNANRSYLFPLKVGKIQSLDW